MSVAGISSSGFYSTEAPPINMQQLRRAFQKLGQDLPWGSLSAAQSDFATLQQLQPQGSRAASSKSNHPIAQAFSQLSKGLQSGNLSAAQHASPAIAQARQSQAAHGRHRHTRGSGSVPRVTSGMNRPLDRADTGLQSGDLSAAPNAFIPLLQEFQQCNQNGAQTSSASSSSSTSVSVNA
jgi:hypothetical protein